MRNGVPLTQETKQKISEAQRGEKNHNYGKSLSNETKRKLRIKAIENIESLKGQISPRYNPVACKLFEQINKELGWNGKHAENGGEFYVKELGYWVDYYEPILNIVIEFDEKHHCSLSNQLKDSVRQNEIINYLGCKFYRILESNSKKWKTILSI